MLILVFQSNCAYIDSVMDGMFAPSSPRKHYALERMQDFDLSTGRRSTQKVDCGSLSRLQDPYELR